MSPSLRADNGAGLTGTDLVFAVLLHLLVVTVIAVLAFWQQQNRQEPLKRIEVSMISAKDLARMQQRAKTPPKPGIHKQRKPKPHISKPKPKPKPRARPVAKPKPEPDFDPFAPLVSGSSPSSARAAAPRRELADLAGKQLSQQEKDRYIAMIRNAVQQHWKVPASVAYQHDPLVEMRLNPDGSVAAVRVLESSGNASLDASLTRAIRAAAPFQLPRKQFEFFRVNRIRFHPLG